TIFFATFVCTCSIRTFSPRPTPTFCLRIPSILIMSRPSSSGCACHTMASADFFPTSLTMSPVDTPSSLFALESILAIPLPISFWNASATLRFDAISTTDHYLPILLLRFHRYLRVYQRMLFKAHNRRERDVVRSLDLYQTQCVLPIQAQCPLADLGD